MSQKNSIKRRSFLSGLGATTASTTVLASSAIARPKYRWRMVSRWDAKFPNQFAAARRLADRIAFLSGGQLTI
jgi:TRAP-type mannitol/chloroaromatic compound transport system substrate-binding protein